MANAGEMMNARHSPETKQAVRAVFLQANLPLQHTPPPAEETATGTMEVLLLNRAVDMLPWAGWTEAATGQPASQPSPQGASLKGEQRCAHSGREAPEEPTQPPLKPALRGAPS